MSAVYEMDTGIHKNALHLGTSIKKTYFSGLVITFYGYAKFCNNNNNSNNEYTKRQETLMMLS